MARRARQNIDVFVTGTPKAWLRLEGAAVLAASVVAYRWQLGGWGTFALLFLAPDLSMLGYLAGPALGARLYNLVHSYVAPIFLIMYGIHVGRNDFVPLGLIWTAHIGLDRLIGFGLKYSTSFGETHLGRVGRENK